MKYMTINNRKVAFTDEKNVLSVIRNNGINLPTFCYHSDLSTYGACRMCVVEDDRGRIFATCSETPRDGMVIYTNSPRIQHHRKMILELLLSSHCKEHTDCVTCHINGKCSLQKLSQQLGVYNVRFKNTKPTYPIDLSSDSIVIDPNKCILCGDCVRTCEEMQGVGVLDFAYRGSKMQVMPAFGRKLAETDCVGCGQCRVACPTGAITIKHNLSPVWEKIMDPNCRVVVQIAPAVRVAVGDLFGIPKGTNSLGVLTTALRLIGFDEIYDTNFGADLTVIEESKELVERITKNENLPLFTSCCPAWVKFCERRHPNLAKHISTCRSPQQMFGALLKEDARMNTVDKRETIVVSIMPCTAKKAEINRPEHYTDGVKDVDYVITTAEISRMIQSAGIDLSTLQPEALDMPFGLSSGAGAIFGVTGGVTEAVLRHIVGTERDANINYDSIRGDEEFKEISINLGDREVKIAVVSGLKRADDLMKQIEAGEVYYDFVEVMACRRGCIAGGGQPLPIGPRTKKARLSGLYRVDSESQIKKSKDNPIVDYIYNGLLKGKEHKLLHNDKHNK
ncbi:MAG: (2Fe-2S)-binding protein [Acholeplasmatales bacterium]|nr:(2Fe-2S)-binding protein [Acholeplasmatales bacterium]